MTILGTKPPLNLREEINSLKKPSGIIGEQLLRANSTEDVFSTIIGSLGFKNRIVNGNMAVAQRYGVGGSFNTVGNVFNSPFGIYSTANYGMSVVDKTFVADNTGTNATGTISQSTVTEDFVPSRYACKFTRTSSASARTTFDSRFQHNIEGNQVLDFNANTPISISFYARASKSGRATYAIWVDGGGGYYCTLPVELTPYWKRYSVTFPGIPKSLIGNGTNRGLGTGLYWSNTWYSPSPRIWASSLSGSSIDDFASSGDWLEFTCHQLELAPAPTPFEWKPYTTEVQLCQRYCEVLTGVNNTRLALSGQGEGLNIFPVYYTKENMRTGPGVYISAASDFKIVTYAGNSYTATGVWADNMTSFGGSFGVSVASSLTGVGGFLCAANSNAKIVLTADV